MAAERALPWRVRVLLFTVGSGRLFLLHGAIGGPGHTGSPQLTNYHAGVPDQHPGA